MAKLERRTTAHVVSLYLLALICLIGANFFLARALDPQALDADEGEYYLLSQTPLFSHAELCFRRTLGHPILLKLFSHFGSDLYTLRLAVMFFFATVAPLTYLLLRRLCGSERVALLSGIITALWPNFLYYGSSLYSEATSLPFFVFFLILLVHLLRQASPWWQSIVAGIVLGVCCHIRPMYLLFLPLALGLLAVSCGKSWRTAFVKAFPFFLGWVLCVAPWSLWISHVGGKPILLSANGGETLAGGLNPHVLRLGQKTFTTSDGRTSWFGPGKWSATTELLSDEEESLPYLRKDELLRQRALHWIWENPASAAYLEMSKLAYMWLGIPLPPSPFSLFLWMGVLPLLVLETFALMALILWFRHRISIPPMLCLLPLFSSLVALISWGSWRFRQPADIGLIGLAALAITYWVSPKSAGTVTNP